MDSFIPQTIFYMLYIDIKMVISMSPKQITKIVIEKVEQLYHLKKLLKK
jgi:hypothetical protein